MKKYKQWITFLLIIVMMVYIVPPTTASASVKLNKAKQTIYVGSSTTLTMKGTGKKVSFTSNKRSVATVTSQGKVVGKKAGQAIITAKVGRKKSYMQNNSKESVFESESNNDGRK